MNDLEKLGEQLGKSGKSDKLKSIADSDAGRAVGRMVDAEAVQKAAKSGDMAALQNILRGVLSTDEGKRLAESLKKAME